MGSLKNVNIQGLNENLSEFIGAYLGDGTITKYFIKFTGDARYDKPYFEYLENLVVDLFGIKASMYSDKRFGKNQLYLTICSRTLCEFLNKKYGLIYGDKLVNNTLIPNKILKNKKLSIACLRGLIDTDGSVSRRGRHGSQFCVQFSSHNNNLLNQVHKFGKKIGVFTYLTGIETGTNNWKNILKYFRIVGSSNPRHVTRFYLKYKFNNVIYVKEFPKYYKKYKKHIVLPFKLGLMV